MIEEDERIKEHTHIPYIDRYRVPYWCYGSFDSDKLRCRRCYPEVSKPCRNKNTDCINWSPIIMTFSKDLTKDD